MLIARHRLMDIDQILQGVSENKSGVKFAYWITKNRQRIEPEARAVNEALKPGPGMEKFEEARRNLIFKHADKNPDGSPVTGSNGMVNVDAENLQAFSEEFKALAEEHKDVIEADRARVGERNEFMAETIVWSGHQIALANIPDGMFSPLEFSFLMDAGLISEPEE